jgi:hypothetical protein
MKVIPVVLVSVFVLSMCGGRTEAPHDSLDVFHGLETTDLALEEPEPDTFPDLIEADEIPDLIPEPDIAPSSILPGTSCLKITPGQVNFGGVYVGEMKTETVTLATCADKVLKIDGIYFGEGASATYQLDLSLLPHVPAPDAPIVLHPGNKLEQVRACNCFAFISPIPISRTESSQFYAAAQSYSGE